MAGTEQHSSFVVLVDSGEVKPSRGRLVPFLLRLPLLDEIFESRDWSATNGFIHVAHVQIYNLAHLRNGWRSPDPKKDVISRLCTSAFSEQHPQTATSTAITIRSIDWQVSDSTSISASSSSSFYSLLRSALNEFVCTLFAWAIAVLVGGSHGQHYFIVCQEEWDWSRTFRTIQKDGQGCCIRDNPLRRPETRHER